jgi:hypothetical protein
MRELAPRIFMHTLVDARLAPWEPDPGIPGFKQQILHEDVVRESVIKRWHVPPGWGDEILQGQPHRHFHRSVTERSYHLFGDFPHWEFENAADETGTMLTFRPGYFMDRPPGSLHGLMPGEVSESGSVILYWNTGPGTSVNEPKAAEETIDVPFGPEARLTRQQFEAATIFDSATHPWTSSKTAGWKTKLLAAAGNEQPAISLIAVPLNAIPESKIIQSDPVDYSWIYVLNGDLQLAIGDEVFDLVEDCFLGWDSDSSPQWTKGPPSNGGCVVLCSGHAL